MQSKTASRGDFNAYTLFQIQNIFSSFLTFSTCIRKKNRYSKLSINWSIRDDFKESLHRFCLSLGNTDTNSFLHLMSTIDSKCYETISYTLTNMTDREKMITHICYSKSKCYWTRHSPTYI